MKKGFLLILIIISILFVTGCDDEKDVVISNGTRVNVSKMGHKHCSREAKAGDGITVELNYDLYYKDEDLLLLKSVEKINTTDSTSLDTYENAYNGIKVHYDGLEYYDQEVVRDSESVTNTITINYEKIDIQKLLDIEGEEDNVIENGKAKVDKWITLAKKFGTKCEEVTEE